MLRCKVEEALRRKGCDDSFLRWTFPVSLTGAASIWLRNQPSGSITTCELLKTKFLNKYSPPARTAKKMEEINNFQQEPDVSLFRAWERFKELLMKCPQHYLTNIQEVILFYNGLDVPTRQILDSKDAIPSKTATDAKIAIQEMVEYSQKWHNGTSSRTKSTKTSNGFAAIQAQLNNLGREIKKVNEKVYASQVGCKLCKGPHYTKDCPQKEKGKTLEEAYYTQTNLEESLTKFMAESAKRHEENSNIINGIRASTDATIRNQGASIKTIEIQIIKMSKVLQERGFGSLPSSTETNPQDKTLVDLGASVSVMPFSTYTNLGLLTLDFIILDIPEDDDVPLILGRPRHAEGRKSGARLSEGHFIGRLAMHFGLVSDEGLRGLQVVTRELPLIDLHELGRLNICTRYGDTWAWVAQGPERQHAAVAGAHEADEADPAAEEDAQEIPAPA
ncbi:zf-CCHC domain-containing protein [Tanacetum coccineum]